jgi:purine nucleoside permease
MNPFSYFFGYAQNSQNALNGLEAIAAEQIVPRVLIIAMFNQEAANWLSDESAIKFDQAIYVPGLSRGYEHVHCNADKTVCLLVTGIACKVLSFLGYANS